MIPTHRQDRARAIAIAAMRQALARQRPGSPAYARLSEQLFDLMSRKTKP